jgi:hypothetical protein
LPPVYVARAGQSGRPGAPAELAGRYEDLLERLSRLEREYALEPSGGAELAGPTVSLSPAVDGLSRREREVLSLLAPSTQGSCSITSASTAA